jgi:hypothetical protein
VLKRIIPTLAVLALATVVAAGCGGSGKDIKEVSSCLKDAKFKTERAGKDDPQVADGVSGLTSSKDQGELAIALAATVKKQGDVKKFEKKVGELIDQLKQQKKDKYQFRKGTDGKYVWVVAGVKGAKTFDKGLACVQP